MQVPAISALSAGILGRGSLYYINSKREVLCIHSAGYSLLCRPKSLM
ncbi:hypothetical protein RUMHYD_01362 [Blautia hydrogenotrophica DSM 10507]|uniref:Uncharacterized protein n=1 Tax=Blautia hydrogenotrophica (strain DSM 10507 / JCM 14656 / S5a33) TaxID=476272 RepID=C0CKJ2_BLAHS|nr:hypothetical protein RUMHYD_01362 [Blautia hydrogenotrophica DSM 10507]